uniref:Macro domain-containing protein n=1 Tax=Macrostomum lignano TaxID=282301 RepID=A0A1I8IZR8_9PLAT
GGGTGGGGGQSGAASPIADTHGLLLLRTDVRSSDMADGSSGVNGDFADVLFAFPPRRQSRLCGLRGFLMAAWSVWPDLLPGRAKSSANGAAAEEAKSAGAGEFPCRTLTFEDPDGQEVTAAMRPCQLSNARLVCVLAAPTAWLNGSGADTVQLAGHLLDLFLLLGWPRGNPVQTSSQEEANEDTAGYNEPLCQLLQVN